MISGLLGLHPEGQQSQREEEKPANNYGHFAADGRYQTERPSSAAPTPVPEQAPAAPAAEPAKQDGGDDWGLGSVSASLLSQNKDRFEEQRRDNAMRSSGPTPADRAASGNNGPAGKNYGGGKGFNRFSQTDNNGGNKGMKGNWGKNRFDNGQKDARSKGNWRDNMGKGSQDNRQNFGNPKGKKGGYNSKGGNKGGYNKGKGKNYGNNNGGYGGNDGGF